MEDIFTCEGASFHIPGKRAKYNSWEARLFARNSFATDSRNLNRWFVLECVDDIPRSGQKNLVEVENFTINKCSQIISF